MKVVIATCFKSNEERVSFVKEAFESKGDDVVVLTTDFDHTKHQIRTDKNREFCYIPTKPYKRNLSISRILSHINFAKDAFRQIENIKPDCIWLMAPANSLIKEAAIYKKKFKSTKLVIDIIDMWPESLPSILKNFALITNLWRRIRTKNINVADYLVSECEYYLDTLGKEYLGRIYTLYWARDSKPVHSKLDLSANKLSLVYLGSINNIIDINTIKELISKLDCKVVLNVIGEGENKENFINQLSSVCEIVDHGEQRDPKKKEEILKHCHAGLNIYNENLYIGLTVKSIDYMQYGLPIINNIKGDTWALVEKEKIGFNITKNAFLSSKDIIDMRKNNEHIYRVYEEKFTKKQFLDKCYQIIEEVKK